MENLSLMGKFADPALIGSLSAGEKAAGALVTTCMGMGVTFLVLVLLWAAIAAMSKAVGATVKAEAKGAEAAGPVGAGTEETPPEVVAAVIAAAIAAYEADCGRPGSRLIVRRIARDSGNCWGNAGLEECMQARKFQK